MNPPAGDKPSEEDKAGSDFLGGPAIPQQHLVYDAKNPTDLVITGVDLRDSGLLFVDLCGIDIPVKDLILLEDKTTIPVPVLEKLNLYNTENYILAFVFRNTWVNNCSVTIDIRGVENGDNTTPPSEDTKDEVVFDKNNPKDLEIPGLEIGTELVDSVVINGEEFDVEYKTSLARISIKPSVYVVDGKLVVPVAVLEYLGLDSENLDITVNSANGKVLYKVVNLVPPVNEDNDSLNGNQNLTSNGNSSVNGNSNGSSSNSTPNGSVTGANTQTKLPNTGAPVSAGLVGSVITAVGALLSRRRK